MWCPHCIREVSPGLGGSAPPLCPLCGRAVEAVTRQSQAVRQAREILERWQASDLFERITSSDVIPESKSKTRETPARLPQPERSRAIDLTAIPVSIPAESVASKSNTPPRLNPPPAIPQVIQPVIPSAIQSAVRPVSRSVIRELPQLPFDLLAPAPVVAAAAEAPESAPVVAQAASESRTVATISSPADWEPPPGSGNLFGTGDTTVAATLHAATPDESHVAVQSTADDEADAEIAAFFESSATGFFSDADGPGLNVAAGTLDRDLQKTNVLAERGVARAEGDPEKETNTFPPSPVAVPIQEGSGDAVSEPETVDSELLASFPATESFAMAARVVESPALTVTAASISLPEAGIESVVTSVATPPPAADERPAAAAADASPAAPEVPVGPASAVAPMAAAAAPVAAAVDDAAAVSLLLPTQPRRSRPALQRPPLVRRSHSPSETVPSYSGTIPMNRNQDAETASSGHPQPAGPAVVSNSPESGFRERRDRAESMTGNPLPTSSWGRSAHRYIDEPHGSGLRGPHFEVGPPPRSNITTIIGQALAYIGVISLLIGTSLVILGHFGGETEYTPTGWLITTVAQMLLFLGIINLVSGSMEQHNDEVARRIYSLSEHLIRIEETTAEALRTARPPQVPQRQEPVEMVSAGDRRQA